MVATFTTNTHLELQATGDNSGTWGSELNTAVFTILDNVLGNVQTISLSSTDVTLSTVQTQVNFIKLTGTLTANVNVIFPAIGRTYFVQNNTTGAFTVTLKIAAGATAVSAQGLGQFFVLDGTNVVLASHNTFLDGLFAVLNSADITKKLALSLSGITTGTTRTVTAPDASGVMMLTGAGITTIASASTPNLGASPTIEVSITGTTTITGFGTVAAGTRRKGVFTGSLVVTYNASSLILPGAASITTAAGDTFEAESLGSGNWRVLWYQRASGNAVIAVGLNQTWQSVTGSRSLNTAYQNTQARPIQVSVTAGSSGNSSFALQSSTDNVSFTEIGHCNTNATAGNVTAVIAPGGYYKAFTAGGGGIAIQQWSELI